MEAELDGIDALDSRRFEIAIKRLATSLSYGTDHSAFVGSGVEYVQSRPYEWGDPVRSIDWRVTARAGRVFVKEFESPKRMPCYLLLDTSASMTIASHAWSKYRTAVFIAGGIALACLDRVSPVGVVGVGGRDLLVRPSLSRNHVMQWMMQLVRYRFDEPTTLARRIREITPSLAERVLMIVLSDLHDDAALNGLKRLSRLHDCAVLQFVDPAEWSLKGAGFLRAREAETGREIVTHGRRRHLDQPSIDAALKRSGIDHLVIRTDRPYVADLRRFFHARGLLQRGAR